MLQQEFESRLGRQLKDNENFNTIHDIYMASSLEKDAFTEEWKKKDHGCLLENFAANWLRTVDILKKGAEACDVTIRCYLLGECLSKVLDDLYDGIEDSND